VELLDGVGLARSSYFYQRARLDAADKYAEVRRTLTDIFERNHRCYGYRRLQASLARQRASISEKVVQRLMKQESLVVAKPKRRRYGSYLGEISPAPDNLLNRDIRAAAPNKKWLSLGSLPHRIPRESWTSGVKPVQAFIRIPLVRKYSFDAHPVRWVHDSASFRGRRQTRSQRESPLSEACTAGSTGGEHGCETRGKQQSVEGPCDGVAGFA
jgi:hypothetical protein